MLVVDPSNPVVALCVDGMQLEGTPDLARKRFEQAWALRQDDYDASIAAHFVARHQPTIAATLEWNQRALRHAEAVADDRVRPFMPSLLLNLGDSFLAGGQVAEARRAGERALAAVAELPDDGYRAFVARGIERLLSRARAAPSDGNPLLLPVTTAGGALLETSAVARTSLLDLQGSLQAPLAPERLTPAFNRHTRVSPK
jgi:hypothetical protein